jgi:hypothetical protein
VTIFIFEKPERTLLLERPGLRCVDVITDLETRNSENNCHLSFYSTLSI